MSALTPFLFIHCEIVNRNKCYFPIVPVMPGRVFKDSDTI